MLDSEKQEKQRIKQKVLSQNKRNGYKPKGVKN